jgi:hypothetical protein
VSHSEHGVEQVEWSNTAWLVQLSTAAVQPGACSCIAPHMSWPSQHPGGPLHSVLTNPFTCITLVCCHNEVCSLEPAQQTAGVHTACSSTYVMSRQPHQTVFKHHFKCDKRHAMRRPRHCHRLASVRKTGIPPSIWRPRQVA